MAWHVIEIPQVLTGIVVTSQTSGGGSYFVFDDAVTPFRAIYQGRSIDAVALADKLNSVDYPA